MARPKVSISLLNGQLGQVTPSEDGVAALLMTGVATANIALGESKKITSVEEAEDLLLNAAYDVTNTTNVYKSIVDFFKEAGEGSELWIMIVAKTNLMAAMCDVANSMLKKLLDDAGGRCRIAAVTRVPDGAYVAAYTNQIDTDVINALPKAHALAEDFATKFKPVRIILDGRDFQGNTTTLGDLKALYEYNRVQVALFTDVSASDNAAVGLLLGRYANKPAQRNPGRVKDGAVGKHAFDSSGQFVTTEPIENAYLTGQSTLIEALTDAAQDAVHDKGYVSLRKYASKTGYFFTDDPTAAPADDDYNSFARGRVIDKAIVITNEVYTEEILDDLEVDENGRIEAGVIKDYQSKIKKEIDAQMTTPGNISSCRVVIDPKQNVLSTNKVDIDLYLTPKFYSKEIAVRLGFENPANA
jgi:hypothetical protein